MRNEWEALKVWSVFVCVSYGVQELANNRHPSEMQPNKFIIDVRAQTGTHMHNLPIDIYFLNTGIHDSNHTK